MLTPYWSGRLGKKKLDARQISSRVGVLECEDHGDRVRLRGCVKFFTDGQISVAD
jgi:hypothetical protein